jgi:hypothetical protein
MMVIDHFALFVPRVFSPQSAATEGHPLNKEVERLTFVRCRSNRPPEVGGDAAEQTPPDRSPI